jgi:membrane fusion protein, multidrug efflux system
MSFKRFYARNKVVIIILVILFLFLMYYLYLHRHPRTDDAFIVANIRPVSALVSGHITKIYVKNNQQVKKGDKLFTVFKIPYELKVKQLKNSMKAAQYSAEAFKEQLVIDELKIKGKLSLYENSNYLAKQAIELNKVHAVPTKSAEILVRKREVAQAELKIAEAGMNVTKENLQNAYALVESLTAELEEAKVNLNLTTIYAQSDGIVSNMYLSKSVYAERGKPLFSFIDTDSWWIQANIKETELAYVKKGQKVWIKLWLYPGKYFEGRVSNIGWNVNRQLSSSENQLAEVIKENEWFLLPQRFPVQIKITDKDIDKYPLHVGATATVIIDTEDNLIRHLFWQIDFF